MKKIKIVVASKNPVKIQCAESAFQKVFTKSAVFVEGISVTSEVPDQPMTDQETFQGAINRTHNAQKEIAEADFWIGIEGGINDQNEIMEAFAWVYITSSTQQGKARTASFDLPPKIRELILQGIELGHADDMVFERTNSKQNNGAVGILTHNLIDRASYYEPAVILALIPFVNQELY